MATKIQVRRDSAADWNILNPTLSEGEIGYETDTGKFKIGNGSSFWSALDYFNVEVDLSGYLTSSSASTIYLTQDSASTNYATKTYADNAAAAIVDSAPSTLNTLNELAAALGDDANFASTVATSLGNKLDTSSASTTYLTQASASTTYAPIVPTTQTGFRNVLINGGFAIDQRNNGEQHTVSSTPAYTTDRWYAYLAPGSPFTVPSQRIAGSAPSQYHYRIGGSMGNDALGVGQRIEAANSFHLAGKNVTLSINIASSVLTSITWTAFRANTTDTFGTLASPTRTQIATGTFSINSTLSQKTATFEVPLDATTGIEILFTTGSLPMGETVTFSQAQLELGTIATPFEQRPIGTELALCQRYFYRTPVGVLGYGYVVNSNTVEVSIPFPVTMRRIAVSGDVSVSTLDLFSFNVGSTSGLVPTSIVWNSGSSVQQLNLFVGYTTAGLTAGQGSRLFTGSTGIISTNAEL
jgi:hypothetical protein